MSHAEQAAVVPDGNPAIVGVPTFLVGSVALGLVLVGFVPAPPAAASIPIIATATAFGQILSTGTVQVLSAVVGLEVVGGMVVLLSGFFEQEIAVWAEHD